MISAWLIARCVASRSTIWGREVAVKIRRDMPFAFQPFGEVADGVVPLTMHHHQCLLAARHLENLEQLLVAQNQIVIGHEDLEGRVAVLDERWQFLAEHDRSRVGYDEMK